MSETAVQDPPVPTDAEIAAETRPDVALGLLKEYTGKLRGVTDRAKLVATRQGGSLTQALKMQDDESDWAATVADAEDLWVSFNKLRPAATDLARYASNLIENVRLSHITKLELRLRLAEFESALETAATAVRKPARK